MEDKIKKLLGLNLPTNVVSTATGVPEADIIALLSGEKFANEVANLRVMNLSEAAERDQAYNDIEDSILDKIRTQLEDGLFAVANPGLLVKTLATVNAAKRRSAPQELQSQAARPVATLIIPITIATKFVVDSKNQVIDVEGQSLATMPAAGVQKALENLRTGEASNTSEHEKDLDRAREVARNIQTLKTGAPVQVLALPLHVQL